MNKRHLTTIALWILLVGLVGCGQTGPLYLPDADSKVVITPKADPVNE